MTNIYEAIVQGILTSLDFEVETLERRLRNGDRPTERQCNRLLEHAARIEGVVKIARKDEQRPYEAAS